MTFIVGRTLRMVERLASEAHPHLPSTPWTEYPIQLVPTPRTQSYMLIFPWTNSHHRYLQCARALLSTTLTFHAVYILPCQMQECNLWATIREVSMKQKQSCFTNKRHAESGDFLFFDLLTSCWLTCISLLQDNKREFKWLLVCWIYDNHYLMTKKDKWLILEYLLACC